MTAKRGKPRTAPIAPPAPGAAGAAGAPGAARASGMALFLVIAVVGLAAVLGFAMLSSATLQTRTGANAQRGGSVDYLIESGINLAMYYLQYPEKAPALNSSGYWAGTNGHIALSASVPGTVKVKVTRDASDSWTYEIESTGTITSGTTEISKKGGARVYVQNAFVAKSSAAFNYTTQVNGGTKLDGDVYCAKTLTMKSLPTPAIITGVGYCKLATTGFGFTSPAGGYSQTLPGTNVSPLSTELFMYYPNYTYKETQYNAGTITNSDLSSNVLSGAPGVVTRGSSGSNPMGVWYCDANNISSGGPLKFSNDVTINGTLVVKGNLQLAGSNIRITRNSGFPALVVTGDIELVNPLNSVTINGVVFVGGQLKSSLSTTPLSSLTINGALLGGNDAAAPLNGSLNCSMTVKYDTNYTTASDLSWKLRSPTGVSIIRWGLPS
jgi:hypothetical protein